MSQPLTGHGSLRSRTGLDRTSLEISGEDYDIRKEGETIAKRKGRNKKKLGPSNTRVMGVGGISGTQKNRSNIDYRTRRKVTGPA